MWLAPVVTSAAAVEPLLLDDAKQHLRVDGTDNDDEITTQITVARGAVEAMTGTRLITQTVAMRTDCWDDLDRLPLAPVQSITSVVYTDTDGASQTLAASVYEARLYGLSPSIVLKYNQVWPTARTGSLIVVTAVVGYGTAGTDCPPALVHAMKLMVGDLFAFRETAQVGAVASAIPSQAAVDNLLAPHRVYLL